MSVPLLHEFTTSIHPEGVVQSLEGERGIVLLRSSQLGMSQARYSYVAAAPFLTFRSFGTRCELWSAQEGLRVQFGNPWHVLDRLMARYELNEEMDLPFPLGGCFGYWGYDLKNFVEPKLPAKADADLELPDCQVGFYDSLVVFDHVLHKTLVVSTGLAIDGSRTESQSRKQVEFWEGHLREPKDSLAPSGTANSCSRHIESNFAREDFLEAVRRAQGYIKAGDVYQVNLSQRLRAPWEVRGWDLFQRMSASSPAPFGAFLDGGDFQIVSCSPELFLRLSGAHIMTRPIKGTRPRSCDPLRDAQLSYELQTSPKEMAELVMITDLLRNDLGRVCEYGSIVVPELMRLERYSHVQHLVSTIEGRLRPNVTHLAALAQCFPGGSVTGAPKIRAMEIIDELEPVARGPYTGCLGYMGFNRESQLSVIIRTAICKGGWSYYQVGAGIVADSQPEAEYEETLAKAAGFIEHDRQTETVQNQKAAAATSAD